MKTILVITDFSNASKNAEVYASELAKFNNSKLLLYDLSETLTEVKPELTAVLTEVEIEQKLNKEASFINNLSNVKVECLEKKSNSIDDIIQLEKNGDIDLVIIGISNLIPLDDLIFKGKIHDLIKMTSIPIILIPEESSFKKIEQIVFAIDFELENKLKMHPSITTIVNLFKAKIFVLNVVKENTDIRPHNKKISENNIENYFGNMNHMYSFIENNDVINGLKEFITINDIDMITMLPHKHNLLEKMFTESKTRKMAFHTTIPLLLLPEG